MSLSFREHLVRALFPLVATSLQPCSVLQDGEGASTQGPLWATRERGQGQQVAAQCG